MKKIYKLFLFLFFTTIHNLQASHTAGGDLTYTCIGPNQYEITLKLFRDCSGITMSNPVYVSFTNTCGLTNPANLAVNLINPSTGTNCTGATISCATEISQLCAGQMPNSTCNGGTLPGMQMYQYKGVVTLPAGCNSWSMAFAECCRNTSVNITSAQSYDIYIRATLNTGNAPCNNSPSFTAQPIPYVCVNQPVSYSYGVEESDGDDLTFELISALSGATTNCPYNAGYSGTIPVPGITINPSTGQINFTPTTLGIFVVVVKVNEWRNGMLIGTTMRDIQFVVQNCTNNVPNPNGGQISSLTGTAVAIGPYALELCEGDNFTFNAAFNDPNPADILQLVTNITSVLPGATFTTSGTNPVTATISWTATGGTSGTNTNFSITVNDGACPVQGTQTVTYDINVLEGTFAGPDLYYCTGGGAVQLGVTGGTSFTWTPSSGLNCTNCANPQASPSTSTQYIVTSNLSSGTCKNKDTVIVNVVPDFPMTMSPSSASICMYGSVQLNAQAGPSGAPFSYTWSPSTGLSSANVANPIADPLTSTTYSVTVTSSNGCQRTMNVPVTVSGVAPQVTATANANMICPGTPVQLEASVVGGNCGAASIPCSLTSLATLGTGTAANTSTGYPAIYGNWYWGAKHQILILASELQAQGLTSGKLRSLAFNVTTLNGGTSSYQGFRIGMKCTNATALTTYETGLSTVFPAQNITVATGWNTHNFSTHYEWDGSSNIIVEICFNNSSYTYSASTTYTPTTFNSVLYDYGDNSTVCSTNPTLTSNNRPNIRFGYCNIPPPTNLTYSWSPSTTLDNPTIYNPVASPQSTTTYTVSAADGSCVGNSSVTITTDNTNSVTATPDPDPVTCPGDPVQLNSTFNGPIPPATLPCGANNTTCVTAQNNYTLGTGTASNTTTAYPAIYGNYYWGARHQILYTAAELTAAGISSGTITQIAFDVASISGTTSYSSFTIKMACTNLTALSSWVSTGLQTVYSVPSWTVVTGWNQHNLTTRFDWDGTSNIIVEVCFNNSSWTNNSSTRYTTTSYNSVLYYRSDASGICTIASTPTTSTFRPNTRFRHCPVQVGTLAYSWSPSTGLSNPNIPNPVAITSAQTSYVVTVTGANCILTDTVTIMMCNTLPVELLSFSGKKYSEGNQLEWITETEINNDYFIIERSIDGKRFVSLGKVKGAGNSLETNNYIFLDEKALNGVNYYRLKQMDFDGKSSFSEIIALENNQNNIVQKIYPNPYENTFYIDIYSPKAQEVKIEITDIYGKSILMKEGAAKEGSTTFSIETSNLAQGIYHARITFPQSDHFEINKLIKY